MVDSPAPPIISNPDGRKFGHAWVSDAPAREILTRASGFMDAHDFTLNSCGGHSFGCAYCYAAFFSRDAKSRDDWGRWVKFRNGKFVASTREQALDLMAAKLESDRDSFRDEYMRRYRDTLSALRRRLPNLGEGKDGFAPPF